VDDEDQPFYNSQFEGKLKTWGKGACASFHSSKISDGFYDLSIKTAETILSDAKIKRHFNIKINGMVVVAEFNILEYVSRCDAMELIIEFQVKEGVLVPSGFFDGVSLGPNQNIIIGFCYGDDDPTDDYNPSYLISGFYIAELEGIANGAKPSTCSTPNCRNPILVDNPELCEKSGCEINQNTGYCGRVGEICGLDDFLSECRRQNSYYAVGGELCSNPYTAPICTATGTPLACHFNYYRFTAWDVKYDCRGLTYIRCSQAPHTNQDFWNSGIYPIYDQGVAAIFLGWSHNPNSLCDAKIYPLTNVDCNDGDGGLYRDQMVGRHDSWGNGKCFTHSFSVVDGFYEISIKTGESILEDQSVERHFNIRLNDLVVVRELNIRNYVDACVGIEIIVEFEVSGDVVSVNGFEDQSLPNDAVLNLGFCFGDYPPNSTYDPNFLISSFYVSRMVSPN